MWAGFFPFRAMVQLERLTVLALLAVCPAAQPLIGSGYQDRNRGLPCPAEESSESMPF